MRPKLPTILAFAVAVSTAFVAGRAFSAPTAAELAARSDAATKAFTLAKSTYANGTGTIEVLCQWSLRVYASDRASGKTTAASDQLARMKVIEAEAQTKLKAGIATQLDVLTATYYRAEAEGLVNP